MEKNELQGLEDAKLLEGYRATGDLRYFQEIFGRYRLRIRTACARFFRGNQSLAEDATQDTFLKAFQAAGQDTIHNIGSWLHKVARNSCIDIHRKEHAAIFKSHSDRDPAMVVTGTNEETQLKETRIRELIQRINELGQKQRISLKLYLEGYSYQEIARITHYSENEVKSAIQTGKENLRKSFQG